MHICIRWNELEVWNECAGEANQLQNNTRTTVTLITS